MTISYPLNAILHRQDKQNRNLSFWSIFNYSYITQSVKILQRNSTVALYKVILLNTFVTLEFLT